MLSSFQHFSVTSEDEDLSQRIQGINYASKLWHINFSELNLENFIVLPPSDLVAKNFEYNS